MATGNTQLTALELQGLQAITRSDYYERGRDSIVWDFSVYDICPFRGKTRSGVFSSLVQKGLIVITEGDKRIEFKRNDARYGTNIYIYQENSNLYIYNAITLNMIAYKNSLNKIINVTLPLYLTINYSLKHQLLLLGYEKLYYNIKDVNKNKLISNIIRNRIINLKNILINIQRILYQIYNKYDNNIIFIMVLLEFLIFYYSNMF
jgi:hypothetical protein